jgi:hypothetical protein
MALGIGIGISPVFKTLFGGGGITPASSSITYTGQTPTLTGVAILIAAGAGASVVYTTQLLLVSAPAIVAAGAGATVSYTGGEAPDTGGDAYAVEGFSPPVVADFENEYYRVGGSDSDFDSMLTYTSGDAPSTQTDSDGLLKWCPHNFQRGSEDAFDTAAYWRPTSATTVTDSGVNDPDGLSAFLVDGDGTGINSIDNYGTGSGDYGQNGGIVQTFHARVKAAPTDSASEVHIELPTAKVRFNLSTGAHIASTGSVLDYTTNDAGDGYFDISMTAVKANAFHFWKVVADNSALNATGFLISRAHLYRSDLGGMVDNPDTGDSYVPTTTAARYLARRGNHVYNGTSWVNKGLLLETEARTNTLAYSNNFSTSWSISAAGSLTITANNSTGPDGNSSLHKIAVTDATSEAHILFDTVTTTSGVTHCFSAVFEDNDQQFVCLEIYDSTNRWVAAVFDVQNKTVTQESVGVNDSVLVGADIIDLGGGLYRCWVSGTISNGDESGQARIMFVDSGTPTLSTSGVYSYAGTGGEYLNGGFTQFEVGSTPSSIIPTSGATVTRPAQALEIPAANMSYSATAMSFHMKGTLTGIDDGQRYSSYLYRVVNDSNNFIQLLRRSDSSGGTGSPYARQRVAGGTTYEVTAAVDEIGEGVNQPFNAAARYTNDELNVASNGTASTAETGPTSLPTLTADVEFFSLGADYTMGNITLFRQWDADITDIGIETAST